MLSLSICWLNKTPGFFQTKPKALNTDISTEISTPKKTKVRATSFIIKNALFLPDIYLSFVLVWRGPPPKKPRRILKLVSLRLQRECGLLSFFHFMCKKYIAALVLLHCCIKSANKRNSPLVIALNCSPSNLLPERWAFSFCRLRRLRQFLPDLRISAIRRCYSFGHNGQRCNNYKKEPPMQKLKNVKTTLISVLPASLMLASFHVAAIVQQKLFF